MASPVPQEARAMRSRDISDEDAYALALRSPTLQDITADITFMVGRTRVEEVHAHKLILARRSDYFAEALLRRKFVDNRVDNRSRSNSFKISNMEPGGFRIMLGYLYNKKIDLPPIPAGGDTNNQVCLLLETLQCSKVINEPELENACTALLTERLTVQNLINCLNIATKYKCTTFQQNVLEFVGRNFSSLIWRDVFNEFSEEVLTSVLQLEGWYHPEKLIFDAVVQWARNKHRVEARLGFGFVIMSSETLRSVMGRTFHAIRFPLMTFNEQREIVIMYPGLFNDSEMEQLYKCILNLESDPDGPFNTRQRRRVTRPTTERVHVANPNQEENG